MVNASQDLKQLLLQSKQRTNEERKSRDTDNRTVSVSNLLVLLRAIGEEDAFLHVAVKNLLNGRHVTFDDILDLWRRTTTSIRQGGTGHHEQKVWGASFSMTVIEFSLPMSRRVNITPKPSLATETPLPSSVFVAGTDEAPCASGGWSESSPPRSGPPIEKQLSVQRAPRALTSLHQGWNLKWNQQLMYYGSTNQFRDWINFSIRLYFIIYLYLIWK